MAITPFPCVTLTGGPESRGRQYGQALKPRSPPSVALYGGALDGFGMSAAQKTALIADYARRIGDFDEGLKFFDIQFAWLPVLRRSSPQDSTT
ncbi:hypothetical protein G6F45_014191 [Rhizopus arrhizus]|nr:hypothetical protein G6F45_014191 [Rhizopus arrhizus]